MLFPSVKTLVLRVRRLFPQHEYAEIVEVRPSPVISGHRPSTDDLIKRRKAEIVELSCQYLKISDRKVVAKLFAVESEYRQTKKELKETKKLRKEAISKGGNEAEKYKMTTVGLMQRLTILSENRSRLRSKFIHVRAELMRANCRLRSVKDRFRLEKADIRYGTVLYRRNTV